MSAAVEGALDSIPSIGFSLLDHSQEADFSEGEKYIRKIVSSVLESSLPEGVCINVNIPKSIEGKQIKGMKVCRQAKANWEEEFDERVDPKGRKYYWLTGKFVNYDKEEDTDERALENHYVSVVPVQYDVTAYHAISTINNIL